MTALASGHKPSSWVSPWPSTAYQKPVKSASVIYNNAVVAKNASGEWVPASADSTLVCYGFARLGDADSFTGDGTKEIIVDTGCKLLTGSGLSQANEGATVYAVDDQTFSLSSSSGVRPVMGVLEKFVSSTSGHVSIHPIQSKMLAVEVSAASTQGAVSLLLASWREVTSGGDVGNIAAIGGVLASDTTPILRGDAAESWEIVWAAGNADPISLSVSLPADFDDTADASLDLWVYTDNAGGGGIDAATFTVETSWNGGALVSDTATDGTPAITHHKITATIANADIPAGAAYVTIALTPAAHAADPTQLVAARLNYKRKILTS